MHYQKKPIIVEAEQLTWENWDAVCALIPNVYFLGGVYRNEDETAVNGSTNLVGVKIRTGDGNECLVKRGDYVVIDSKGFPYPCNKEIFESGHELIK